MPRDHSLLLKCLRFPAATINPGRGRLPQEMEDGSAIAPEGCLQTALSLYKDEMGWKGNIRVHQF